MTEAEILEAMMNSQALAMGAMMLYLSIIGGYLVVAYVIGAALTRAQMLFVSAIFVASAGFATWGSMTYFWWGSLFLEQASSLDAATTEGLVQPWQIIGLMQLAGILGSLDFMRNLRRSAVPPLFDAQTLTGARLPHTVEDVSALTDDGDHTERGVR